MNKTTFLAALAAVVMSIPSCRKAPETMKISIFCDHIESVARQEKIPFAEAAKKIKEIGFEGADVRVFTKPEELKTLDSLGFAHSCVITDIDYSNPDQKELEDKTIDFMDKYGYDRLMLVAGFIPEGGFSQAEMDDARQRIAAFAARVTAKGYKILIEDYDHERSFTSNAERLDSLFAVSKDLGLVFDTGNFQFSGQDAMEQFEHFRRHVKKSEQDLLPMVDVEESGVRGLSRSDLQQRLNEFMQLVKQEYGKYPLLYSQYGFYNKMLAPEFNKYFIFIARYGKSTPNLHGPGKHNIWQFTEKGRVSGISGHVDLDKFDNGTTLRNILLH